jgi:hypothetical protein
MITYDDCEDGELWMNDWSNERMSDCPDPDEEEFEDDEMNDEF